MRTPGLLLIFVTVCIHHNTCSTYPRGTYSVVKDGKTITCLLCQPGTKFVADCPLDHTRAICSSCDRGTFESCYNRSPFCADCTHVCPPRFEHVPTCNATHDNTCECQAGMYRRDSNTCLTHTICQPGEQIQRLGSQYKNTECVPCPRGTYSTTKNSSQCRKCRVCTWNQQEKPPCNGTRDAVCTENRGVLSGIVIGVLLVLVTGVSIWCYIKRRKRNYRQQQPAVEMANADRDYDVVHDDMEAGQGVNILRNHVDQYVSATLRCRAEMCTAEMFLWLKAKIPIKKKRFIFCRLFGDDDAVEEHEEIHSNNIQLQMYTLLLRWKNKLGLKATADKVVNALVEEECETIANEFMNEFKLHEN